MIVNAIAHRIMRTVIAPLITPAMAASAMSRHGAARRRRENLTIAERRAATNAALAAENAVRIPPRLPRPGEVHNQQQRA